MTVISPPLFQSVDAYYDGSHLGLPYRDIVSEGVVGTTALAVSERGAGANMSVDVAAGAAWILGDDSAQQPCYRVYNDATVNLAVTAADGTNPRIDRVVAEVRDSAFSGVSQDWRLRVIAGTPAGSPAAPAIPDNAISLATISVPAADTTISDAQITDTRSFAQLHGAAKPLIAQAKVSSAQAITSGVWTDVTFQTEVFDNGGIFTTAANTRFTAPMDGIYCFCAMVTIQVSPAGGGRWISFMKNGTARLGEFHREATSASNGYLPLTDYYQLAKGDYLTIQVFQDSGGSLNVQADAADMPSHATLHLVSAL